MSILSYQGKKNVARIMHNHIQAALLAFFIFLVFFLQNAVWRITASLCFLLITMIMLKKICAFRMLHVSD